LIEGEWKGNLAALIFYQFVVAAKEEGMFIPSGTRDIRCDDTLCGYLTYCDLHDLDSIEYHDINVVKRCFKGLPVKQVHGVVQGTVMPIRDFAERDTYLRGYASRREEKEVG
jgi:hypothetical protein